MPMGSRLARFNHRVTDRAIRIAAHRPSGFAIIADAGRRTGRRYQTPVNVSRTPDGHVIALGCGTNAGWVENAAGGCGLHTTDGRACLSQPRSAADPSRGWAPAPVRLMLGLIGASRYLNRPELTRAAERGSRRPGKRGRRGPPMLEAVDGGWV